MGLARRKATSGQADPEAERLAGDRGRRRPAEIGADGGDAADDREGDDAEHVVEHGGAEDGDALGGVELVDVAEHARGDADAGGGEDRADEQRGDEDGFAGVVAGEVGEHRDVDDADAQREGSDQPDDGDERGGADVAQELLEVRVQAGDEQQDDAGELARTTRRRR